MNYVLLGAWLALIVIGYRASVSLLAKNGLL